MMSATNFCPVSAQDYQNHVSRWIGSFNIHTSNWPKNETFINYAPLSNTAILKARYGTDIEIRKTRNKKYYVLHIPLAGPFICYLNGKEKVIQPKQAFMVYPGMDVELVFPKDCETLVLRIDEAFFLNNLSMLGGNTRRESYPLEGYSLDMLGDSGQLLNQALDYLQAEAWSSARLTEHPGFISNLESVISCRIITALGMADTCPNENIVQDNNNQQVVREATHYIENHIEENISTIQIARYCGVSSRTLQRAFMKAYGVSPLTWLRQARLRGVRNELISPSASQARSITAIAMNWGFNDLGRFAAQYRDYFGELPKETLRIGRKVSKTFLNTCS